MIPFAPLFAKGRSHQQTVTAFGMVGGVTSLTCSGPVAGITVGSRIFVSDANGGNPEYLGRAMAVAGNQITCQLKTQFTRGGGGLVWTPTNWWQSSLPGVWARETLQPSGVEVVETTGRAPLLTRTAEAREVVRFTFRNCPVSEWEAYSYWMRVVVNGRLGTWTAVWYNPEQALTTCVRVKDNRADAPLQAEAVAYRLRGWVCELAVVSYLTYVD